MDGDPRLRNRVVLLVQPDRDDREMYVEFLRGAGLTPVAVGDARTALTLAPKADAIVTGILLAGDMDGIALVERLRADERFGSIPLIVLSACAYPKDRDRARSAGCDVFLAKPCVPVELLRQLRLLLSARRGSRAPRKTGLRATRRERRTGTDR